MSNKSVRDTVLEDGTKIKLSLSVKRDTDYTTVEEVKATTDAIMQMCREVIDMTLCENITDAIKALFNLSTEAEE